MKKFPKIVVGVLVYNNKGEIFLAKQKKWEDKWTIPGGHLDYGEHLQDCAKREVKEETGMDVSNIEFIGIQESVFSKEYYKEKHMVFVDFCGKAEDNEVVLNDEMQEYQWIDPQDALHLDLGSSTKKLIENFIELGV